MVSYVIGLIIRCVAYLSNWLSAIFVVTGTLNVYWGVMFIVLGYRFILKPIFGGSDTADMKRTRDAMARHSKTLK